jgi:hypothetical protein
MIRAGDRRVLQNVPRDANNLWRLRHIAVVHQDWPHDNQQAPPVHV